MPIIPRWQLPPLLWAVVTVLALCLPLASQAQNPHDPVKSGLLLVTIETPRTDGTEGAPETHAANGVLVSNDGLVLTSYSVFRTGQNTAEAKISVQFGGANDEFEKPLEAEVAGIKDDFGLLTLQILDVPEDRQRAKTDPSFKITKATPLDAYGYDTGAGGSSKTWSSEVVLEEGHVSSKFLPTTLDFSESQIGASVYNDAGNLVGIMTGDSTTFDGSRSDGKQAITPIRYAESLIPHVRLWDMAASIEGLLERLPEDFNATDLNAKVDAFEELFAALRIYEWEILADPQEQDLSVTFKRVLGGEPRLSVLSVRVQPHAEKKTPLKTIKLDKEVPTSIADRGGNVELDEVLEEISIVNKYLQNDKITSATVEILPSLSNDKRLPHITRCYSMEENAVCPDLEERQ